MSENDHSGTWTPGQTKAGRGDLSPLSQHEDTKEIIVQSGPITKDMYKAPCGYIYINKSYLYLHLVNKTNYKMAQVLQGIPAWSVDGGMTHTPYPPIPKNYKYSIWEMNPGYENHPDYKTWQRLESDPEVIQKFPNLKNWWAPERDLFMLVHGDYYSRKFCPCRVCRDKGSERYFDLGYPWPYTK